MCAFKIWRGKLNYTPKFSGKISLELTAPFYCAGVAVGDGFIVGDGLSVGDGFNVGDGERVGVKVGVEVAVGVGEIVIKGEEVAVGLGLSNGVGVKIGVGVGMPNLLLSCPNPFKSNCAIFAVSPFSALKLSLIVLTRNDKL